MTNNSLSLLIAGWLTLVMFNGCITTPATDRAEKSSGWEKIGPGGGGATFIPTFSYSSPEKFLLRCDMTGSYLSCDGGSSYRQINFPGGASAYAWDPADPNTIYIGSASLNHSPDGGLTWKRIYPAEDEITGEQYMSDHADYSIKVSRGSLYDTLSGRISAIRCDPSGNGNVYFSMGKNFYYRHGSDKTWNRKTLNGNINYIYSPQDKMGSEFYIFTEASLTIFNKTDGSFFTRELPGKMSPAFSITGGTERSSGKILFYALHHDQSQEIDGEFGHTEIWISADKGVSWEQLSDPVITNSSTGIKPSYSMLACAESDAGSAWLITNRYEEKKASGGFVYWYGALKTADAGKSWNWTWKGGGGSGQYGVKDGHGVDNLQDAWAEKAFGGEYIRLMDVGVAPANGNIAIVTDWYRTMKTTDGGKTWKEIYSRTMPDGTFASRGLDVTTAYGVHFDPFDSSHIAISYTDIGLHNSFNGGRSWSRSVEGVPNEWVNTCYWVVFDPAVKGKMWSAWSNIHDLPKGKMTRSPLWKDRARGGICISTDGGRTWKAGTEGMGGNSPTTCIAIDPDSPKESRTLWATVYGQGVFRSDDDGKTWREKNKGIGENKSAFEITRTSNGTLFLTVSATPRHNDGKKGREFLSGALYRSDDKGDTWIKLNVTGEPFFPNGLDYDRKNPLKIYLGCWSAVELSDLVGGDVARSTGGNVLINMPGGIFMSEDGGNTWKSIFDKKQYVYDVTVDPGKPGRLYCCTFNRAAYMSDNYGASWDLLKGYDFHWGHRVIIDENHKDKIYITTFGSSVLHGLPVPVSQQAPSGRNDAWGFSGAGGGGAMFNPAVSYQNPDFACVACDMTGSFVTSDGGRSWRMFCLHGPVRFFTFDPADSNTVYASSIALFRSSDRGKTWNVVYPTASEIKKVIPKGDHAEERIVTTDSTLREVQAFAIDPDNSTMLHVVTEINATSSYFISNDKGATWTKIKDLDKNIKDIYIDPSSPANDRKIYFTHSDGITVLEKSNWKTTSLPAGVARFNSFAGGFDSAAKKFIMYAITGKSYFNQEDDKPGIFITSDGGKSWENRIAGLAGLSGGKPGEPELRAIATSIRHPEKVYVSYRGVKISGDTVTMGVAVSSDYGESWKLAWKDLLAKGGEIYSPNYEKGWLDYRFGPTWGENPFNIAVAPSNPGICYATDFGRTIKTADGGISWQQVYTKRKDGAGWSSRGLEVTTGYALLIDPFDINHRFIATTDIGLMESNDGGESWNSATMNNGIPRNWANSTYWLAFDPLVKGRAWAAMSNVHDLPRPKMFRRNGVKGYQGGIVVTEDGGRIWKPSGKDIGEAAVTHILAVPETGKQSLLLYACAFGKGVYKSVDQGKTWKLKNKGIDGPEPFAWRITRNEKNGELYLIVCRRSDDGSIGNEKDGAVYRSNDEAETWVKMKLPEGTNGPMSIAVDPENNGRILLSAWGRVSPGRFSEDTGGGIFLSADNGITWRNVLSKDQHIHDLTFDSRNGVYYACGFNGSAYRSDDKGTNWSRLRGYNFKWGKRVDPDPNDPDKVYIITFGGGVWHGPAKGDPNAVEDIVTPVFAK